MNSIADGSADRIDGDSGRQLREKIGALLRHDFASFAQLFQRMQRRRLEQQGDLICPAIDLLGDLLWIGGISLGDFLAAAELRPDDYFQQITLKDRDVQLPPRGAFFRLERFKNIRILRQTLVELSGSPVV